MSNIDFINNENDYVKIKNLINKNYFAGEVKESYIIVYSTAFKNFSFDLKFMNSKSFFASFL